MRLLSFRHADTPKYGALVEGGIVDLYRRLGERWPSLRAAIAGKALDQLAAATKGQKPDFGMEDVEMLPVIPDPQKILCTTSPLSRVVSCRRCGSAMTSAVTIHGPSGAVAGKFLPAVTECFWKSRTEPSRKQV